MAVTAERLLADLLALDNSRDKIAPLSELMRWSDSNMCCKVSHCTR